MNKNKGLVSGIHYQGQPINKKGYKTEKIKKVNLQGKYAAYEDRSLRGVVNAVRMFDVYNIQYVGGKMVGRT
jgi:hypothetical protein